nr:hypothetical protein [uncultured archaeon]
MIGIIGAMDDEIAMYLDHITVEKKVKYSIFTFYKGTFHNQKVVLVKSGVGKVFAAMITQYLIDKFNVDTILFTGVGGSLNKSLKIGDVVISTDSAHHDFNAIPLGFKRGQISYTNYRFFKADATLRKIALKAKLNTHKIIPGRILTGDQFFTQREKKAHKYLTQELKGDCIEMEGAAVAQVCTMNKIPHLIIRTVSDQANGTAVKDYNSFKHIVAANSFQIVHHIIESMN